MTTQDNNEAASAPATCKSCDGEGVIHTGIGECPTTLCNKCDGVGTVSVQAASASQSSTPVPRVDGITNTNSSGASSTAFDDQYAEDPTGAANTDKGGEA